MTIKKWCPKRRIFFSKYVLFCSSEVHLPLTKITPPPTSSKFFRLYYRDSALISDGLKKPCLEGAAPLLLDEQCVGEAHVPVLVALEVRMGLLHQTVDERGLAVVQVARNGNVADHLGVVGQVHQEVLLVHRVWQQMLLRLNFAFLKK